jgi:hypothetical protein
MAWILRLILSLAAPITAWFVARDALNFSFVQTMISVILLAAFVAVLAFWPRRQKQ